MLSISRNRIASSVILALGVGIGIAIRRSRRRLSVMPPARKPVEATPAPTTADAGDLASAHLRYDSTLDAVISDPDVDPDLESSDLDGVDKPDLVGLGEASRADAYGPGTREAGDLYGEPAMPTEDRDEEGHPEFRKYDEKEGQTWTEALWQSTAENGTRDAQPLDRVAFARHDHGAADIRDEDFDIELDDIAPELPPRPDDDDIPVADVGSGGPAGL